MVDIIHRIGVEGGTPEAVYEALATLEGLRGWWTEDTTGSTDLGGVILFRFGPGDIEMKVVELRQNELVRWEVVGGATEWIGTHVEFRVAQDADYTIVLFGHTGWAEPVEFMYHCSTKWASFLLSLKELVETGSGRPAPHDLQISNWH
jgi:uncharacterized protein YndB with AHSA1/START domain